MYEYKNSCLPNRGVIYFIGEETRSQAMFSVTFDEVVTEDSLEESATTVSEIEASRKHRDWHEITETPSEQTCEACDIKRNCPAYSPE